MQKHLFQLIVFISILFSLILTACKDEQVVVKTLVVDYKLLKTGGIPSDSFHVGEKFTMILTITNRTGEIRLYSFTPPDNIFKITSSDTDIVTSIDGWAFPQVFLTDTLRPEQTVSYEWLAPTTPMEPSGILLKPGTYNAIAVATLLSDKYSPSPKMVKEFMIMP